MKNASTLAEQSAEETTAWVRWLGLMEYALPLAPCPASRQVIERQLRAARHWSGLKDEEAA